jgi:hypothetical protein
MVGGSNRSGPLFLWQNISKKKAPEDSGATRVTREMRASESGKS